MYSHYKKNSAYIYLCGFMRCFTNNEDFSSCCYTLLISNKQLILLFTHKRRLFVMLLHSTHYKKFFLKKVLSHIANLTDNEVPILYRISKVPILGKRILCTSSQLYFPSDIPEWYKKKYMVPTV